MHYPVTTVAPRWRLVASTVLLLIVGAIAGVWTAPQVATVPASTSVGPIAVEAVPVPLNPQDQSATALGDFRYAGGLTLRSRQTALLHELSDLILTANDRFSAIGDEGVLLEGRFVFDETARLVNVTDARLSRLIGENGRPLTDGSVDAEGYALLPTGDRLVSFERQARIWLYPGGGGRPRPVPSPPVPFQSNEGMEALTAKPDESDDAYMVGQEETGATWTCRVAGRCVRGLTIDKPREFGLVSMNRLPGGLTAYLLRAYDPVRRNRITLKILRGTTLVSRMDLAPPMTVDNFEGMASAPSINGGRRFYLLSDDNNRPTQRTLLLAFDWLPPGRRNAEREGGR